MSDPVTFTASTARHEIPFLFAGQSQKELFVNEAHARIDALLHAAVDGTANQPPASPADGECWLVGDVPGGSWAGRAGALAAYQAGGWVFATPRDGMRLLDKSSGQEIRFRGGWQRPDAPAQPSGGTTVDSEARAAIIGLIESLIAAGILAQE